MMWIRPRKRFASELCSFGLAENQIVQIVYLLCMHINNVSTILVIKDFCHIL